MRNAISNFQDAISHHQYSSITKGFKCSDRLEIRHNRLLNQKFVTALLLLCIFMILRLTSGLKTLTQQSFQVTTTLGSPFNPYFRNLKTLQVGRYFTVQMNSNKNSKIATTMTASGNHQRLVIVLSGATSVGKSAVARQLCNMYDAEIIISDSVQVYKHLDIGSNKPSLRDQGEVKHHLLDICESSETLSSGDFVRLVHPIIQDIIDRKKVPIIVGGSTMWVQWLVHGVPDAPKATKEIVTLIDDLIGELEKDGLWDEAIHRFAIFDTSRIAKVSRNDWYRLRRYLEVAIGSMSASELESLTSQLYNRLPFPLTGSLNDSGVLDFVETKSSSVTGVRKKKPLEEFDVRCFFLSEERIELYSTIDTRCLEMIENGLFEEVTTLIEHDRIGNMGAKAIGYRQTIKYLCSDWKINDKAILDAYIRDFATATRNYAKRQLGWYRRDKQFLWLEIFRTTEQSSDNKVLPYQCVANEIRHWCHVDGQHFSANIVRQFDQAAAVNVLRRKRLSSGHLKRSFSEIGAKMSNDQVADDCSQSTFNEASMNEAKCALAKAGEIVLSPEELNHFESISAADKTDLTYLSALDPLIRANESKESLRRLKAYTANSLPQLSKLDSSRLDAIMDVADICAQRLHDEQKDKVEKFQLWLLSDVPLGGANDYEQSR